MTIECGSPSDRDRWMVMTACDDIDNRIIVVEVVILCLPMRVRIARSRSSSSLRLRMSVYASTQIDRSNKLNRKL